MIKQILKAKPVFITRVPLLAWLAATACIFCPGQAVSADFFTSGPQRVNVLELYTSEGCSSCPPADRWLSELQQDDRLWHEIVPVAFHVDYWNYIGWQDRYSSPEFSKRQRDYARSKGLSTVYTPGFLLNGREWRSFFGLRRLQLDNGSGAGRLTVSLDRQTVMATYHPGGQEIKQLEVNIAVLGFGLVTEVESGENRGKQLKHDFAVLGYKMLPMTVAGDGYTITTQLPRVTVTAPRSGIAVWINNGDDPTPLQATGGWIQ